MRNIKTGYKYSTITIFENWKKKTKEYLVRIVFKSETTAAFFLEKTKLGGTFVVMLQQNIRTSKPSFMTIIVFGSNKNKKMGYDQKYTLQYKMKRSLKVLVKIDKKHTFFLCVIDMK